MAIKLGRNAQIQYLDGGIDATGSFATLGNVRDVTVNGTADLIDITTRDTVGWKANAQGLKDMSFDVELLWDPDDAGAQVFRAAFRAGSLVGVRVLDEASGDGDEVNVYVTGFTKGEPLGDAQTVSMTLQIAAAPTLITDGTSG